MQNFSNIALNLEAGELLERAMECMGRSWTGQWEVFLSRSLETSFELKEGELDSLNNFDTWGMALRLIRDKRCGFSYTYDLSTEGMEEAFEQARRTLAMVSEDEAYGFPHPAQSPPPRLDILDKEAHNVSLEEKMDKVREMEFSALNVDKRIRIVRKAAYEEGCLEVHIINSNGLRGNYSKSLFSASIIAVAEGKGDSTLGWDYDFRHKLADLDMKVLGKNAGTMAARLLGGKRISPGRSKVILTNKIACQFLGMLAPSFLGENVLKGRSFLKDKLDVKAFSTKLYIIDSGLATLGSASAPFDDEGTHSKENMLVKQGTVGCFLYDTYWARRADKQSTGNNRRGSVTSQPQLGMTNIYLKGNGIVNLQGLVKEMGIGVVVSDVLGLHTVDTVSGDFSVGAVGLMVEAGEITYPVRGFTIAGNLREVFLDIEEVGSDLRFLGRLGSPSLLVGGMDISG